MAIFLMTAVLPACSSDGSSDDGSATDFEANEAIARVEQLASAQGVRSVTKTFENLEFKAGGTVRARSRNGSVTWYEDVDLSQWVKVSAQLIDESTDQMCAKIRFFRSNFAYAHECYSVWTTRSASQKWDRARKFVQVLVYRDQSNDNQYEPEDWTADSAEIDAPPGWN
jgi:hypothetical protein